MIAIKYEGTSDDSGAFLKRAARATLGILFYFLATMTMEGILALINLGAVALLDDLLASAVPVVVGVYGAVVVRRKLELYEKIITEADCREATEIAALPM